MNRFFKKNKKINKYIGCGLKGSLTLSVSYIERNMSNIANRIIPAKLSLTISDPSSTISNVSGLLNKLKYFYVLKFPKASYEADNLKIHVNKFIAKYFSNMEYIITLEFGVGGNNPHLNIMVNNKIEGLKSKWNNLFVNNLRKLLADDYFYFECISNSTKIYFYITKGTNHLMFTSLLFI